MLSVLAIALGLLVVSFLFVERQAVQLRQTNEVLTDRLREHTARLEVTLFNE
jgi:hypothetical protein